MSNLPNVPRPGEGSGRTEPGMTQMRVRLLAELAIALVERGQASRMVVETSGQTALMLRPVWGQSAVGVVIRARARWAYLWDGTHRHPADDMAAIRAAAAALAGR
ncbi:hypothetical protein SAMN04489712_12192 [Thermomonospora echinospora]|uniref:Uncharacterized protein n=1 Tax=Thermomonospora echinospora TaxID=1992 RepID=A0A1H6DSD8_9ACTN|nr:hypothetical protein [Thermomonospora echinospora]SEG88179.1 hypothetical protein SAMN04489712_12192 [Thermomonospora echinospora]